METNGFIYIDSEEGKGRAENNLTYTLPFIAEIQKDHIVEVAFYSLHVDDTSITVGANNDTVHILEQRDGQPDINYNFQLTNGIFTNREFTEMLQTRLTDESQAQGYGLDYSVGTNTSGRLVIINLNTLQNRRFTLRFDLFTADARDLFGTTLFVPYASILLLGFYTYISDLRVFYTDDDRLQIRSNIIAPVNYCTGSDNNISNILVNNLKMFSFDNVGLTSTGQSAVDHFDFYQPNLIYQPARVLNKSNVYVQFYKECDREPFEFRAGMHYNICLAYKIRRKDTAVRNDVLLTLKDIKGLIKTEKERDKLKDEIKDLKKRKIMVEKKKKI